MKQALKLLRLGLSTNRSNITRLFRLIKQVVYWPFRKIYNFQVTRLIRLGISTNKRKIIMFFLPVLLLEVLSIFLIFKLNGVYGSLYNAIQEYQIPVIWSSVAIFTAIAMVLVVVDGYLGFFINRLAFEIRSGITTHVLSQAARYEGHPFLNQRIQEDIGKFSTTICDLSAAVFKAMLKLPIFLVVIIGLTHWYTGLIILVTTTFGTWLTRKVAQRLVALQADQESNEAGFRVTPTLPSFEIVQKQFLLINSKLKMLSFTQSGLQQIFVLLPFMLLLPLYISKYLLLGPFMQSVNALGKIIDSLLVLIDNRQMIVQLESTLTRLRFLTDESPK